MFVLRKILLSFYIKVRHFNLCEDNIISCLLDVLLNFHIVYRHFKKSMIKLLERSNNGFLLNLVVYSELCCLKTIYLQLV